MDTRFIKTEAVVLNSIKFGEGHKIINLFTEHYGKVEASAFGVRKSISRFGSKLEPFTIAHFLLYHKSEESIYTIKEVEIRFQTSAICEDYQKFIVGNSIIETIILFVEKAQADKSLYRLLAEALKLLNDISTLKIMYLLSMYDIQFLSIMGYGPDIVLCKKCGERIEQNQCFLDNFYGFPICKKCHRGSAVKVLPGTLRFINWAQNQPIIYAKKVTMEESTIKNIRVIIEQLYLSTFYKKPLSWDQL